MNALAGYDRAIVTDIPGTTRDTVEASAVVGGTLLRLSDTAGLRDTADAVERLGVERSRRAASEAELLFVVFDSAATWTAEDTAALRLAASMGCPWVVVWNKTDLPGSAPPPDFARLSADAAGTETPPRPGAAPEVVPLSAKTGAGLAELDAVVGRLFPSGETDAAGSLLTDARQEDAARRAWEAVGRAEAALSSGMTPDAVLTDVEAALDAVGELTGRTAKEEIVSRIFERFCVGK